MPVMKQNEKHSGWLLFQYRVIKLLAMLMSAVPREWLALLAIPLGRLWYALDPHHRQIAFQNMYRAFAGEKNTAEIRRLVRSNFVQFASLALELPSLLRLNRDNLNRFATISGHHHLKKALDSGKGVFLFTAHLGNWELLALGISLFFKIPISVVARPLDYRPMDKLLTEIRCRTGNDVIDKQKGASRIVRMLRSKQVLGILLDQNASWYDGVYVPFFGQTACTNKGLAMFALRYDAAVVPAFNFRQPDGRYTIKLEPPVDLIRTGELERDIIENTATFNRIMEKHIRMAPDSWLWVHNRWRKKQVPPKVQEKIDQMTLQDSGNFEMVQKEST